MSVPTTQKAALVKKAGASLVIEDRHVPQPGPDDVLIEITATAVNPVDWKIQAGGFPVGDFPIVLGSDSAGKVAALGSNVKDLTVGERIFFQGHVVDYDRCTFQQYCIAPAKLVGRTPSKFSDADVAGIPLASIAGVTMLYADEGLGLPVPWGEGGSKIGEGKAVVVLGGSSSVGLYTVQLARLSGFHVVSNSSAAHIDRIKQLGAAEVLDRSKAQPADYAKALGGRPLAGILDAISEEGTQKLAVEIFKAAGAQGKVALVLPKNGGAVAAGKEAGVEFRHIVGMGQREDLRPISSGFYRALEGEDGWLAKGTYVPNIPEVVKGGLPNAQEALDKNKKGVSGVKVVFHNQEGL